MSNWKPISTAPRTRPFLGWAPSHTAGGPEKDIGTYFVSWATRQHDDMWCYYEAPDERCYWKPTHWMPLPDHP